MAQFENETQEKMDIRRSTRPSNRSYFRTPTDTMSRCKLDLGNNRYVQVVKWKGELRVDLREWNDDKPTKKGISLTLM